MVVCDAGAGSGGDIARTPGTRYNCPRCVEHLKGVIMDASNPGFASGEHRFGRASERQFRALLEAAPDAMVIVDTAGTIILVNAQTETLFGYTREELVGQPVEMLIPLDLRQLHQSHRGDFHHAPRVRPMGENLDLRAANRTGDTFPVEISLSPLQGEEGMMVIAAIRDISNRRRAEAQLRQGEALYRAIARNLPNGAVKVIDRDLRYLMAEGELILPVRPEELVGRLVDEALPPELAAERKLSYLSALRGETQRREIPYEGRYYLLQTAPLRDDDGEIYAALAMTVDITEQKEAELTAQSLLRLSQRLTSTLDLRRLLHMITEEAINLTGAAGGLAGLVTGEGIVTTAYLQDGQSHPVHDIWPPHTGIPGHVLATGKPYLTNDAASDPLLNYAFTGRDRVQSLLGVPVVDSRGRTIAYFEVTNKQREGGFTEGDVDKLVGLSRIAAIAIQNARSFARLRELGQQIVSAQEEERRRLAQELHDSAGQTLTALLISLEMLAATVAGEELRARLEELAGVARDAYEEVRSASHALRPPVLDSGDFQEALHAFCTDFSRQVGLPIHFSSDPLPALPEPLRLSFYRFLQESLTNVVRHAQATEATVSVTCGEEAIMLSVHDDGIGMDADGRPAAAPSSPGLGLRGLRERFELIGGDVAIDSAPGQGTTVTARCALIIA
jgi:PAS domain S-box-containing protein